MAVATEPTFHASNGVPFLDIMSPEFNYGIPELINAREKNWYAQTPLGIMVLRYAECNQLLRDRRLAQNGKPYLAMHGVTDGPLYDWFSQSILNLADEEHARVRGAVHKEFRPAVMESLRSSIREAAVRLAVSLPSHGVYEFIDAYAERLPSEVLRHLLGVPAEDREIYSRWTSQLPLCFNLAEGGDIQRRAEAGVLGVYEYVDRLIALKRRQSTGDFVSRLVKAQSASDDLSLDELRNLLVSMTAAGHDSSMLLLGRTMATFAQHPQQWSLLAERPELTPQAVEEIVRFCSSSPVIYRIAGEDFEYQGLSIAKGSFIILCVDSANRDPRVFKEGDSFDISVKREMPPLTFSVGPHFCLGAAAVRIEMAEALTALAQRFGPPSIAGPAVWRKPIGLYGPKSLPLRFG